jgi:hypothetical protein
VKRSRHSVPYSGDCIVRSTLAQGFDGSLQGWVRQEPRGTVAATERRARKAVSAGASRLSMAICEMPALFSRIETGSGDQFAELTRHIGRSEKSLFTK